MRHPAQVLQLPVLRSCHHRLCQPSREGPVSSKHIASKHPASNRLVPKKPVAERHAAEPLPLTVSVSRQTQPLPKRIRCSYKPPPSLSRRRTSLARLPFFASLTRPLLPLSSELIRCPHASPSRTASNATGRFHKTSSFFRLPRRRGA